MSDPTTQTVSLNDIGQRYMSALQHLSDLMVLTWAGARAVNEHGYEETFRSVAGRPSTQFRVPLETASGDLASLAAEINADNGPLDIPTRFKHLKSRYGLTIALETELLSLAALNRCFLQNAGIPKGAPLTVQLKAIQPPAQGTTEPRLADYQRTFQPGEKITVAREEHAAVFTTISVFLSTMLAAVQEFAKASGLPENSSPQ